MFVTFRKADMFTLPLNKKFPVANVPAVMFAAGSVSDILDCGNSPVVFAIGRLFILTLVSVSTSASQKVNNPELLIVTLTTLFVPVQVSLDIRLVTFAIGIVILLPPPLSWSVEHIPNTPVLFIV